MKNLKMFAIAVMAFAVMAMGVRAVETECDSTQYKASIGKACYAYLVDDTSSSTTAALEDIAKGDTIKLLQDVTAEAAAFTVSNDITIDLNGHTLTLTASNGISVQSGAKLTITGNGEIKSATTATAPLITVANGASLVVSGNVKLTQNVGSSYSAYATYPVIMVNANNNSNLTTSVEVGSNVTVKNANGYGLVIGDSNNTTALNTSVKLDGTWTTGQYVVKVNGFIAYNENAPKVDIVGGTFTSTDNIALYAAGYAVWNVNAKTVKGVQAVQVKSGDVTLAGGSYENTDGTISGGGHTGNAVVGVYGQSSNNYPDPEYIDLKITGGSFVAKEEGTYAVEISNAVDSKLSIGGGSFASAEDNKGNQLPVFNIIDNQVDFLDEHEGMITDGEFTGSLIADINDGGQKVTAENATKSLVAGEFTTEGGKVVVGNGANTPSDEGQQPGSTEPGETGDGNQGPTDNVKNPETNDNILVYAGLGLVSLASVAFTAKKRED